MKTYLILSLVLLVSYVGGISTYGYFQRSEGAPTVHGPQAIAPAVESLSAFASRVATQCKAKGSSGRIQAVSEQIAHIAQASFQTREGQEAFILMVCIESRFDNSVRSKVGAIGYTQVMPALVPSFSKDCGLGELSAADASDGEINLRLGACVFSDLLSQFDGNVALALAGYNSGPASPTTKKLGRLIPGNTETMGYVATFYELKESLK